jgi:hypothetical protein
MAWRSLFLLFLHFEAIFGISTSCTIINKDHEIMRLQLEEQYTLNSFNRSIKMVFGHVHHAGGTAVCQLARNNVKTNSKSNCNHPLEFSHTKIPPTRQRVTEQIQFASQTSWDFYAVELSMPQELTFSGPFLYSIILRHPYLLLLSQYRRARVKFQFNGTIQDLISFQFQRVQSSFNYSKLALNHQQERQEKIISTTRDETRGGEEEGGEAREVNYYRGIAGFILGKYSETSLSSESIYQETIRRLEHFSVILLTEEMAFTAQLFHLKFGWNISESYGHSLINSHGTGGELLALARSLSQADREFIRWYGEIDLRVYSYGRCLVEREFKRLLKKRGESTGVGRIAEEGNKFKFPEYSEELKKLERIISEEKEAKRDRE